MGVQDLWKVTTQLGRIQSHSILIFNLQLIKPFSEIKSFRELAIREGFEDLRHGTGIIVLGVDAR
jgi:hypothetical protein